MVPLVPAMVASPVDSPDREGSVMAQLPPDGQWLVQQVGGEVSLFERYTEDEIARWKASDMNEIGSSLEVIAHNERLTEEQKSLATFWAGYFYAHAKLQEH